MYSVKDFKYHQFNTVNRNMAEMLSKLILAVEFDLLVWTMTMKTNKTQTYQQRVQVHFCLDLSQNQDALILQTLSTTELSHTVAAIYGAFNQQCVPPS